jgi:hypothetical protein
MAMYGGVLHCMVSYQWKRRTFICFCANTRDRLEESTRLSRQDIQIGSGFPSGYSQKVILGRSPASWLYEKDRRQNGGRFEGPDGESAFGWTRKWSGALQPTGISEAIAALVSLDTRIGSARSH